VSGPADPFAEEVRRYYEEQHEAIERARRGRARYYYATLARVLRAGIAPGLRILDVGCGTGDLLAGLEPARGVGIDISPRAIAAARERHRDRPLTWLEGDAARPEILAAAGGPFDVVLLVNVVTDLTDVQAMLERLQPLCHARTRVFIYGHSRLWQPLFRAAEALGVRRPHPSDSWLPPEEVKNMLHLADFEVVRTDRQILLPVGVPLVSEALNRWVARLPVATHLSMMYGVVARPMPPRPAASGPAPTVSVVIPCRNEAGHIRPLVSRLPRLPEGSEFLFVEGNSKDDTEAVLKQVIADNPGRGLRFLKQTGVGKGDAVRLAFAEAKGDVVLILDSDMGVAPEDVPKFVDVLVRGKGDFVNGSRLVYPIEGRAMKFLNLLANKFFAILFTYLLGQQVRDTLCGTKALFRRDYETIASNRAFFGDFDPFGDFDLLFGASRLNLKIVDLPVRYHDRTYGQTNISRFRHGLLLLRMSAFAARKLKFV